MSLRDDGRNVSIANTTITLNDTEDLLSAIARCVSRFREINHEIDRFTDALLSHLDILVATKSAELFSSFSTIDNINEPRNGDKNSRFSGQYNIREPQKDGVDGLYCELNNQIQQSCLGENTGSVTEQCVQNPSGEQTEQNTVADHPSRLNETSQPPSSPEMLASNVDAREVPHHEVFAIPHDVDDGIIRLHPSQNQWSKFEKIVQDAKFYVAAGSGICKIVIPTVEKLTEAANSALSCFSYTVQTRENGTIAVKMTPSGTLSSPSQEEDISSLLASTTVSMFEQQTKRKSGLRGVQYCTDIRARTESERNRLGLPASPIWPLSGNKLDRTRARIAGIHWPYAYKSSSSFGAAFAMHQEDWDLYSVNYLYKGSKIWIVIPPSAAALFEQKFRDNSTTDKLSNCAQFIRHSASYVPLGILDRWRVPYKIVRQNAGEAVLTFPRAYHQGFSTGSTLAEAVNYADRDWSPESYAACSLRTCPVVQISRHLMEIRDTDEEQWSADEGEPDDQETISARRTGHSEVEVAEQQSTRCRPRIKSIQKRKAEKGPYESPRKSRKSSRRSIPNSTGNTKILHRKGIFEVLEGVTSRPTIGVGTIYQRLMTLQSDSSVSYDDSRTLTLIRLFYAIASPDAISQLRDACHSIRNGAFLATESTENLSSTVRALDGLNTSDHVVSIAKRFHLVVLSTKRFALRTSLFKRPERLRTKAIQEASDAVFGRNDALALAEMMAEAYPQLKPTRFRNTEGKDEYGKKLKTLKERLASGQKWSKLSEEFASGILALVPTQGEYHVSNRDFERLPVDAIDTLVKMLNEFRGDFLRQVSKSVSTCAANFLRGDQYDGRFSFEDADAGVIRVEKYDSSSLTELCKVGNSQQGPTTG